MKIGTIGSGVIVEEFIQSARTVQGVSFVACYSRTLERAELFARKNNIAKAYDDLDAMLADASLDFIYVASPNSLHFEQAMKAMEAGKNVIVEKPFAGNTDNAKTMIHYAKEKGLYLFEAICNIHMPHFKYIQDHLPEIGKIRVVQCNFSQYSSRYDQLLAGNITNVFDPQFSGGALADINIYNLHFVVALFGRPQAVDYIANQHENGIDTSGIVTLRYDDFVVTCVGAKDSFSQNFGQIQGEKGYIYIPNGVNGINSVNIITKANKTEYNIQDKARLSYQVEVFKDIFDRKDRKACDAYLDHSYRVVEVAQEARKCIGLNFEK